MRALTKAQLVIARAMPEAEVEEYARQTCRLFRVRYYHTHRSQHSPSGFPDDVIVGPRGMLYRENKRESGKVSIDQQGWLDDLAAHGCNVGVWRPSDLLSGRIEEEIRAVAARR